MLKGKHVILRAVERADLRRLHELQRHTDLVMLSDLSWSPVAFAAREKEYDKYLEREFKDWFVIEVDGVVVGDINLQDCNRRTGTASLGVSILDPEYLGKQYGRDAIETLLRWAFVVQNWRRIWLETLATNERALRAYRACGFVEEARLRAHHQTNGEPVDMIVMGLLRWEWEQRQAAQPTAAST